MSLVRYRNGARNYVPTTATGLLERFFNDSLFDNKIIDGDMAFMPKVDIIESDKTYELQFALAGFNKEDFVIDVDDNVLTVSGERKFEEETNEKTYRSVQTSYGSFKRSFSLPENVNAKKIEAKYNNGILEIVIPKDETKIIKTSIAVK
jgi:HSP20 family protein